MNNKRIICLDAGHGGSDPGAVANGMREAEIVFNVTGILKEKLEQAGLAVILSRPDENIDPGINPRWQFANGNQADYFISIHVNAGGGSGAETFYFRDNSERSCRSENFAHYVNNRYAEKMSLRNRGVKPDTQTHLGAIGVLRHTTMPAILVELAFIDSPLSNIDVFILRERQNDIATELADAILHYFDIEKDREASPSQANEITHPAMPRVDIDILGNIKDITGYIDNGRTMVWLVDIIHAISEATGLNLSAVWDDLRHIPVVAETETIAYKPLDSMDGSVLLFEAEEIRLIKNTVHWESRGEDEKGQILVANVILNRLNSPHHPNSITDVILHPGAFTVTQRPDFHKAQPSQLTISAVQQALSGTDHSQGATFFRSLTGISPDVWHERATAEGRLVRLFDHGNHRFYKEA